MKNTQRFQLIDGTFTPSESSQVLLSLVKSKMDYHRMVKFSNEERFDGDLARSEKRVQELTELQIALQKFFDSTAEEQNTSLKINGWIEITEVPNQAQRDLAGCAMAVTATGSA